MAKYTEKKAFIQKMQQRIQKLVIGTVQTAEQANYSLSNKIIFYQLIKSVTSIGANYRASCMARSRNEFFSKISIVVEETDETLYWLKLIKDLKTVKNEDALDILITECEEILKIVITAKSKRYQQAKPLGH